MLYSASNEGSCAQRAQDFYEACDYTSVPTHSIEDGQCMITPPEVSPSTKIYQKCNFMFGEVDGSLAETGAGYHLLQRSEQVFGPGDEQRCLQRGQDFRTVVLDC